MKGISENVDRSLVPLGIEVAHRPAAKIRQQVMQKKDLVAKPEKSDVVFRVQGSSGICNYVIETGRQLQTRMHEHQLAVQRLDPKSEVATHAAGMGHVFYFDAFELVGRSDNYNSRHIKETRISTDASLKRHINLPAHYVVLSGDDQCVEHSGPSSSGPVDPRIQETGVTWEGDANYRPATVRPNKHRRPLAVSINTEQNIGDGYQAFFAVSGHHLEKQTLAVHLPVFGLESDT
ncbi:unnamed protein product [Dibothriocephalus latus]|uniref:Uncharacterized protein n=1 Tax=Dibothriocephalus latus TaxID=60516 RepID=A0A3P7NN17_DIBLA|nr:unnamed protein product [Dibothriocephalus latus]